MSKNAHWYLDLDCTSAIIFFNNLLNQNSSYPYKKCLVTDKQNLNNNILLALLQYQLLEK